MPKIGLSPRLVVNPASEKYCMVKVGDVVSVNAALVASSVGFTSVEVLPGTSVPVNERSSSVEPTASTSDDIVLVYL